MGCYSREFTLSVLQEKPYFSRLSSHLIEQLVALSCDELAKFERAIDAVEGVRGRVRAKAPGAFGGVLAGYSHVHYMRPDWLQANFSQSQRMSPEQELEQTVEKVLERIVDSGRQPLDAVDEAMERFTDRLSNRATGDWLIYEERLVGNFYLAINEHVACGSSDELDLKRLLDGIAR